MRFNVDFDASSSGIIPEGSYVVSVVEVKSGVSKTGNKKLTIKYEIAEGKYKGKPIWDSLSLSENATWRIQQFIGALKLPNTGKQEVDTDRWEGRKLVILVRKNTYEGRESLKVMGFKAYNDEIDNLAKEESKKIVDSPKEAKSYAKKEDIEKDFKDIIG